MERRSNGGEKERRGEGSQGVLKAAADAGGRMSLDEREMATLCGGEHEQCKRRFEVVERVEGEGRGEGDRTDGGEKGKERVDQVELGGRRANASAGFGRVGSQRASTTQ